MRHLLPILGVMGLICTTSCSTLGLNPALPELPESLRECVAKEGLAVPEGPLSREHTAGYVAQLLKSERAHSRCADDFLAFYEGLRAEE